MDHPEVVRDRVGFVGGALSATLIGAAMWWITPFTPLQSAAMAFVIVLKSWET